MYYTMKEANMKKLLLLFVVLAMCVYPKGEEDAIKNYLDKVKIGKAIEYKNLRIFPIIAKKILSTQGYVTLDQASDKGWLKIKEVGSGQVNFVEIKNNGKKPVFAMTGEMISGAKQDRMLNQDVLLPANSGWIRVPVYCVEHGRWTQVTPEFKSEKLLVPNAVRKKAKITESQSEVWDEIAAGQDRLGIASGTGTVIANYKDKDVKEKVDEYAKKFEKVPSVSKSCIGVVVTTGNRIICFDMFANNGLFNKLWKKLIKSYAMDAISGEKGIIEKDDIENFIEALEQANYVSTGTPGLGKLVKIESDFGKGSALIYKSAVVHMDFFPQDGIIDDGGLRLDIRRNQRLED
jgi:hypothetical protein